MFVYPDIGTGGALQPNLESIVGYVPAGYNMLPTPGATQGFQTDWTDFTNARNWSVTGTEFASTAAQLTFKTGLSGPDASAHATKLIETTFNGTHAVCLPAVDFFGHTTFPWNNLDAPIPVRIAAICRAVERTRVVLTFDGGNVTTPTGGSAAYAISIGYDLAGGNTGYDNLIGANLTLIGTHMTSLGDGYWLCYFDHYTSSGALTPSAPANHNYQPAIMLDNGSGTNARSASYAGDGSSGVEVLWFNMLPVAMWNMTVKAFSDEFNDLSGFDLTNSKAPGFKWYLNNIWPNAGNWAPFWNSGNQINAIPTNWTISSPSVVQSFQPTANTGVGFTNFAMQSICTASNTPGTMPGYVGTALPAPLLVEFSQIIVGPNQENAATYNPYWQGDGIGFSSLSGLPTFVDYGWSADALDGQRGFRFNEWDAGEIVGNPARGETHSGAGTFEWRDPGSPVFGTGLQASYASNDLIGSPDHPPADNKYGFRKWASLWVNCAYNNYTWGFYMAFGDGQWAGPVLPYSPSGSVFLSPVAGPQSLGDGHLMPFTFVGSYSNNTLAPGSIKAQTDWFRVWTVPVIPIVYSFWNPYDMGTLGAAGLTPTLSQNGYQVTKPGADASWQSARAHLNVGYNKIGYTPSAGKWYWEHTLTGNSMGNTSDFILGFGNSAATVVGSYPGSSANGAGLQYNTAANTNVSGVTGLTASSITWTSGDVIGFAFDADAGHVYVHKNGTYINGNPGSGNGVWTVSGDTWWPMVAMKTAGSTNAVSSNFGQKAFAFTVPSGYNAGVY